MSLYEDIKSGKEKIALIGLGYVGMPIAVAFAKKVKVVGFDLNREKIEAYRSGKDATKEVGDEAISNSSVLPARRTRSFMTNSAMGLRQMLPQQTNITRILFPDRSGFMRNSSFLFYLITVTSKQLFISAF